jgi:N-acetyl sugar amidotransferase
MSKQVCSRCVMDETVPRIRFDENGICNFCDFHDLLENEYSLENPETRKCLDAIYASTIKQGKGNKYDCVVGVSGGRDSSYLLYHLVREVGLRCLAVYFNDGFGNPAAGENMQKAVLKLGVDLRTVSADWRESKDLKISCLKASTPDLNLATDIGLTAALYGVAAKEGIRTVFVGHSFRTEGIAPLEWNYLDGTYLHAIHKRFGKIPLRKWRPGDPGFHLDWTHMVYYSIYRRIRLVTPFYFISYVRKDVDGILKKELDWVDLGAHYYDDLYQALLTQLVRIKFGIDRRKFNYSALVRSSQMTRKNALDRIAEVYAVEDPKVIDLCIKRLGLSREEFDEIISKPPKTFWEYPNLIGFLRRFSFIIKILAAAHMIPRSTYIKYCSGAI